jgi:Trehalase
MQAELNSNDVADLTAQAHALLKANDRGGYTVPNHSVYPFQWNWDSAFVAIGFATFDCGRAWQELTNLFKGQWSDGMVPSIVFHSNADHYYPGPAAWGTHHEPPTTGITQPPVAATAARKIYLADPDRTRADAELRALFPALYAWHHWWHVTRDPDGTGLATVVHPWETGRDNSPDWDGPLSAIVPTVDVSMLRKDNKVVDPSERPTDFFYNRVMTLVEEAKALRWDGVAVAKSLSMRVCDLGIQSILLRADQDLLVLAETLDFTREAEQLRDWIKTATLAFERLRAPDGSFRSLDLRSGHLSPCVTSASFLPLYARVASADDAKSMATLLQEWEKTTPYLVASSDPYHESYDARRYWRGPLWIVVNYMIAEGFAHYGYHDLAERIRASSAACVQRHGFREAFDSHTGEGVGGRDFSWTAAMWLEWLNPHKRK